VAGKSGGPEPGWGNDAKSAPRFPGTYRESLGLMAQGEEVRVVGGAEELRCADVKGRGVLRKVWKPVKDRNRKTERTGERRGSTYPLIKAVAGGYDARTYQRMRERRPHGTDEGLVSQATGVGKKARERGGHRLGLNRSPGGVRKYRI